MPDFKREIITILLVDCPMCTVFILVTVVRDSGHPSHRPRQTRRRQILTRDSVGNAKKRLGVGGHENNQSILQKLQDKPCNRRLKNGTMREIVNVSASMVDPDLKDGRTFNMELSQLKILLITTVDLISHTSKDSFE